MDSIENNQNNPVTKSSSGFGAQFKNAREQKNITLDDAAGELNILKRHLEAIEKNDFDSLPQAAFTRGFVSSYAKFLKLDVKNVVSHFDSVYPKEQASTQIENVQPKVDNKSLGKVTRNDAKKANFGKFGVVLLALGLIGFAAVYFMLTKKDASTAKPEADPTVLEQMTQEANLTNDASDEDQKDDAEAEKATESDSKSAEEKENASEQTATDAANNENADAATTDTTTETVVADPNVKPAELVFWVIKGTEIKITDQTGAVIMSGEKPRGEHKAKGKPPFKIYIANAPKVRLNMDKVPIKLNKYTVNNEADFTLNK